MTMGHEQDKSYTEIIRAMVEAPTLAFSDPNKPTTVSANASSYILQAVLLQEDNNTKRPVAFASRTMKPAETRCAQIEKKMPSIFVGFRGIRQIPERITTI